MARKKNPRLWARLRVLCSSGLDPMCIAPDALALVRELIPYDAAALFLTDEEGNPYATWQDAAFDCVQSVCVSPEFNAAEDAYKVSHLVLKPEAPKVGQLLAPPKAYFASLTYQEIVRAAGQHHTLDARLDVDGMRKGVISLFRAPGTGFSADEVDEIGRVARYFEHALRSAGCATLADAFVAEEAMVVANRAGEIVYMSEQARVMLRELALRAHRPVQVDRLPPFCQRVVDVLAGEGAHPDLLPFTRTWMPGGIVEARAQWLGAPQGGLEPEDMAGRTPVGIFLKRVEPVQLRVWRSLRPVVLSPQQTEVAFWMGVGAKREQVRERLGVSEAVLRDCVKAIYEKFDCSSEATLAAALRGMAA